MVLESHLNHSSINACYDMLVAHVYVHLVSSITGSPAIPLQEHLIFCCTNLRKVNLNLWGRRTDIQIALSWGVGWSVRFHTAFASH